MSGTQWQFRCVCPLSKCSGVRVERKMAEGSQRYETETLWIRIGSFQLQVINVHIVVHV